MTIDFTNASKNEIQDWIAEGISDPSEGFIEDLNWFIGGIELPSNIPMTREQAFAVTTYVRNLLNPNNYPRMMQALDERIRILAKKSIMDDVNRVKQLRDEQDIPVEVEDEGGPPDSNAKSEAPDDAFTLREIVTDPIIRFFEYRHLPEELAKVSFNFHELAKGIIRNLPKNAERDEALRKLLESKDCAVRAKMG